MDALTRALLNIVSLVQTRPQTKSEFNIPLILNSIHRIPGDLLCELEVDPGAVEKINQQFSDVLSKPEQKTSDRFIALAAVARQIEELIQDWPRFEELLEQANNLLAELTSITGAFHQPSLETLMLVIQNPRIFDYIREWNLQTTEANAPTILVGKVTTESGATKISAASAKIGNPDWIRQIGINYMVDLPFPQLGVGALGLKFNDSSLSFAPITLQEQRPDSGKDAAIYQKGAPPRVLGYIRTRWGSKEDYSLQGSKINLGFAQPEKVELLVTTLFNKQEQPLFKCVKVNLTK